MKINSSEACKVTNKIFEKCVYSFGLQMFALLIRSELALCKIKRYEAELFSVTLYSCCFIYFKQLRTKETKIYLSIFAMFSTACWRSISRSREIFYHINRVCLEFIWLFIRSKHSYPCVLPLGIKRKRKTLCCEVRRYSVREAGLCIINNLITLAQSYTVQM
jgi:hypothetical protein